MSEKKKFTQVYQLEFTLNGRVHPFYIGMTQDPERREREHRTHPHNPNSSDYNNYKYQLIRELDANKIEWRMTILSPMVEDDEDSEYEWVLRAARNNRHDGIKFYNDLPLTNMRRGDLLEEMLADSSINTAEQIREWRSARELRQIAYEAAKFQPAKRDVAANIFSSMGATSSIKGAQRTWTLPKMDKKGKKVVKKSK